MNENVLTINVRNYTHQLEGWGRQAGAVAGKKIRDLINTKGELRLVRLSMQGVRKLDVGFAAEAVVGIVSGLRGKIDVCVVDLANPDVAENLAAAALQANMPVTAWDNMEVRILGPMPRPAHRAVLEYALARTLVTAPDLVRDHDLSISNASTKLKQLWEQGFLARQPRPNPAGGIEHVYRRIG